MDLPPELERAIFEIVARTDPPSIPNLLLVAHRVKIWFVFAWIWAAR